MHVHESPKNMTVPLILLAILSVGGGWFAAPPRLWGGDNHLRIFWRRSLQSGSGRCAAAAADGEHALIGACGRILVAVIVGSHRIPHGLVALHSQPERCRRSCRKASRGLYRLLLDKYFVDEALRAR